MCFYIQRNALGVTSRTGVTLHPESRSPSTWPISTSMTSSTYYFVFSIPDFLLLWLSLISKASGSLQEPLPILLFKDSPLPLATVCESSQMLSDLQPLSPPQLPPVSVDCSHACSALPSGADQLPCFYCSFSLGRSINIHNAGSDFVSSCWGSQVI